jgi:hypothetical protein
MIQDSESQSRRPEQKEQLDDVVRRRLFQPAKSSIEKRQQSPLPGDRPPFWRRPIRVAALKSGRQQSITALGIRTVRTCRCRPKRDDPGRRDTATIPGEIAPPGEAMLPWSRAERDARNTRFQRWVIDLSDTPVSPIPAVPGHSPEFPGTTNSPMGGAQIAFEERPAFLRNALPARDLQRADDVRSVRSEAHPTHTE